MPHFEGVEGDRASRPKGPISNGSGGRIESGWDVDRQHRRGAIDPVVDEARHARPKTSPEEGIDDQIGAMRRPQSRDRDPAGTGP